MVASTGRVVIPVPVVEIITIVKSSLNPTLLPMQVCKQKRLELRVCYCLLIHIECIYKDSVQRLLIIARLCIVAAYLKLPRGNEYHAYRGGVPLEAGLFPMGAVLFRQSSCSQLLRARAEPRDEQNDAEEITLLFDKIDSLAPSGRYVYRRRINSSRNGTRRQKS